MLYCCGISDRGKRENNEDAFLIGHKVFSSAEAEKEVGVPAVAAVADGVGGEASGEVASKMALKLLAELRPSPGADYEKKVLAIHRSLQHCGIQRGSENMQTTLCALAVDENGGAVMINAGDSRLYLYRGGLLRQLSKDQSLVQMLYENGCITSEEKIRHAEKNVIFPVLGSLSEDPRPQIAPVEGGLLRGDLMILCTDGLSDSLTTGEFEDILARPKKLPKRLADLAERALANGSEDNITVVGVLFDQ